MYTHKHNTSTSKIEAIIKKKKFKNETDEVRNVPAIRETASGSFGWVINAIRRRISMIL